MTKVKMILKEKHDSKKSPAIKGKTGAQKHSKKDFTPEGDFVKGHSVGAEYRFKPGQTGNPHGRPKKSIVDEMMEEFLAETVKTPVRFRKKHGRPKRDKAARLLVTAMFYQALAGKRGMAQLIAERVGGKPLQAIDAKVEEVQRDPALIKQRIKELLAKATH